MFTVFTFPIQWSLSCGRPNAGLYRGSKVIAPEHERRKDYGDISRVHGRSDRHTEAVSCHGNLLLFVYSKCFACRVLMHGRCINVLHLINEFRGAVMLFCTLCCQTTSRKYHPFCLETRPYQCSRQLFIQGHGSENLSIIVVYAYVSIFGFLGKFL